MKRLAAKMLLATIACALVWSLAGNDHIRSFIVHADARPAAGLNELQQVIYSSLAGRAEEVNVNYKGDSDELSEQIKHTIRGAIAKDEYTAYIVDSYFYSIRSWNGVSHIKLNLKYRETLAETEAVTQQVREVLGRIVEPGMNDHQKVKAIHDWVVLKLAYDSSLERYTAYEALQSGRAVCQGYALLVYRMMNEAGVPARIVEGAVSTGEHAWNLVQLDGQWYHLDATWDDPVPDVRGKVRYDYYLLRDEQMRRDHSWTLSYPAAAVPYADAVAAGLQSDAARSAFYAELERELGYLWMKKEHTLATAVELRARIESELARGVTELTIRYLNGSSVRKDVQQAAEGVRGLKGYRAAYSPFGPDGAVLLEISLETG